MGIESRGIDEQGFRSTLCIRCDACGDYIRDARSALVRHAYLPDCPHTTFVHKGACDKLISSKRDKQEFWLPLEDALQQILEDVGLTVLEEV